MANNNLKAQEDVLAKTKYPSIEPMQEEALLPLLEKTTNYLLLSQRVTGKLWPFLYPLIDTLKPHIEEVQL